MDVWYLAAYIREGHRVTEKIYSHSATVSEIFILEILFCFSKLLNKDIVEFLFFPYHDD